MSSMQSDPIAMKASELMRLGKMPSAMDIKGGVVRDKQTISPNNTEC